MFREVWSVLEEVHLAKAVTDLKNGLDTEMSEGGANLSVGQSNVVVSICEAIYQFALKRN